MAVVEVVDELPDLREEEEVRERVQEEEEEEERVEEKEEEEVPKLSKKAMKRKAASERWDLL